jgi:hypothetical protein
VAVRVNRHQWVRFLRHPKGPRSPTVRLTLMMMSTWANSAADNMWPSIETLAVATNQHRDTVQRALAEAVSEGYVIREPRGPGPDPVTAARLHGYNYAATIPDSWPIARLEERWERDPEFVSERTRRPRRKPGRVPDVDRDTTQSGVPVVCLERPGPVPPTSRSCAPDVPAQTDMKGSEEGNGSEIRKGERVRQQISTVIEQNSLLRSPQQQSRRRRNGDFEQILDTIERLAVDFQLRGKELDCNDVDTLAALTDCTKAQITSAVEQLKDRGRLPLPPRRKQSGASA